MNQGIFKIAAGIGVGYFVVKKFAYKPLHKLAVSTTKGAMDLGDRVASAGNAVTQSWQDIVEEARFEIDKKKDARLIPKADSMMDTVSANVAGYMYKTAATIENLADRLEFRDNDENLEMLSEEEE